VRVSFERYTTPCPAHETSVCAPTVLPKEELDTALDEAISTPAAARLSSYLLMFTPMGADSVS
jgi:hypothetical protein